MHGLLTEGENQYSAGMISRPNNAPGSAGVYIFSRGGRPLYIGKALNLKKRLASYFRKNVPDKIRRLRNEATRLAWIELSSDIEALITEAELIKRHHPPYNYLLKDDKNYFYVGFTTEAFPRVFLTHQPMAVQKPKIGSRNYTSKPKTDYTGPFTDGNAIKTTLRLLRKAFPYCTCAALHARPCLNAEIGRCLGFCCLKNRAASAEEKKQYAENIKNISAVLSGGRKEILRVLKRAIRRAAAAAEFEAAARLRDQMFGVENVFRHRPILASRAPRGARRRADWQKIELTLRMIFGTDRSFARIEGYDISNISGTEATGSMVVFVNGVPARQEYRQFKINSVRGPNDVAMHREVLRRRLAHPEWPLPALVLIDGGRPQLGAALEALGARYRGAIIPAALAKREEELYLPGKPPLRLASLPRHTEHLFRHIRDESHRFAKRYHHKRREMVYRTAYAPKG